MVELARLNMGAVLQWELGVLYSPDEIADVDVAFHALAVACERPRRLRVEVTIVVREVE